jgi:hypothetical protein
MSENNGNGKIVSPTTNSAAKIDLTKPGRMAENGASTAAYIATTAASAALLTLFGIGRGIVKGAVPAIIDGVKDGTKLGLGKSVVQFPMRREETMEPEQRRQSERKVFGGKVISKWEAAQEQQAGIQQQIVEHEELPV